MTFSFGVSLYFGWLCFDDVSMYYVTEGENRKDKEQEVKTVMKRLETKYASLQVVPVIGKFGNTKVGEIWFILIVLAWLRWNNQLFDE